MQLSADPSTEFQSLRCSRTFLTNHMQTSMFWVKSDLRGAALVQRWQWKFFIMIHQMLPRPACLYFLEMSLTICVGTSAILQPCPPCMCFSASPRRPGFSFQHQHGCSEPYEIQTPSSGSHGNCTHVVYKHTCNVFSILK